jgi:L-ascorbate metabolism protein UlaG (beta-lactamase superfamily)
MILQRFFIVISIVFTIILHIKGGNAMSVENIKWLGHDTFKIVEGGLKIYTDPFKIKPDEPADIILISHAHYDHCSPDDVVKIATNNTTIVTTPDCAKQLNGKIKTIKPGDNIKVDKLEIKVIPAYNINKNFHPKANNWVGFIFTISNKKYYFTGDTDYIPEMNQLKNENIDVAFIPVSGTFVMDANEAVKATLAIMPKIAIPMHYGSIVGSEGDAKLFKEKLEGKVEVHIL